MKLSALLDRLAVDLNDAAPGHEFTKWSRAQLEGYILEALQTIYQERPDQFLEQKVLRVEGCSVLQELCDCDEIHRVLGQSTADGRVLHPLRRRSNDENLMWSGFVCRGDPNKFQLRDYSLDEETDDLQVYPPPPPGTDVYILVECSVMPADLSSGEIKEAQIPAVVQWVLYRAKMVDGENNQLIVTVAAAHKTTFWELVVAMKDDVNLTAAQKARNVRSTP